MTTLQSQFLCVAGISYEELIVSLSSYLLSLPNSPSYVHCWLKNVSHKWPHTQHPFILAPQFHSSGCFARSLQPWQIYLFSTTWRDTGVSDISPYPVLSGVSFSPCFLKPHFNFSGPSPSLTSLASIIIWNFNTFIKYRLSKYSYIMMIW